MINTDNYQAFDLRGLHNAIGEYFDANCIVSFEEMNGMTIESTEKIKFNTSYDSIGRLLKFESGAFAILAVDVCSKWEGEWPSREVFLDVEACWYPEVLELLMPKEILSRWGELKQKDKHKREEARQVKVDASLEIYDLAEYERLKLKYQ